MNDSMHATFHILLRLSHLRLLLACIIGLFAGTMYAQTNPSVRDLPYNQNFGSVAHNSTSYPTGWQGWRIANVPSAVFETTPALSDLALLANSTAATNTGGVHNYNGTIGLLNSGSVNGALALSINTTRRTTIVVNYELATIRNPYNGSTNTRINEATLQYRIGTTGNFTTVSDPPYTTGTTTQTNPVTTPIGATSFSVTLPSICDGQPIVQLRWITRDNTGSGSRPSIALDQVNVSGTCTSATITYAGSPYCNNAGTAIPTVIGATGGTFSATGMTIIPSTGAITLSSSSSGTVHYQLTAQNGCSAIDATALVQINQSAIADAGGPYNSIEAAPVSISATANGPGSWSGGNGVFNNANDPSTTYTPTLTERGFTIELTWVTNDPDGAGPCSSVPDIANLDVDFLVYTPMFSGGTGRGDGYSALNIPSTYAYMFTGGNGRGDAFSALTGIANFEFMFAGGIGRGDASMSYLAPAINSAIFHGGNGRGDVALVYQNALVASSIYNGGNGRGDVMGGYSNMPIASTLYSGGNGRGDISMTYTNPFIASAIYSGGDGRGDVSRTLAVNAATYYSRSNGSTIDPIWATQPLGTPNFASWGPLASMVVQNGHSVTSATSTPLLDLTVEPTATLTLQGGGEMVISGNSIAVRGTLVGEENSALVIDGASFTDPVVSFKYVASNDPRAVQLFDLSVESDLDLQVPLGITGTLQLQDNVDLEFNNGFVPNVTLLSNSTRTGRLGPVPASANYNGTMTIQRYIPAGATNWRLLGSAITSRTVQNWQDDFFTAGYPGSQYPNFFDPPGSGIFWPSIRWYDEPDTGTGQNDGTLGVSSNNQALASGQGFAVWCGDALGGTAPFVIDLGDAPPTIATAPIALPMTWTDTGDPFVDGWNLVSNPVPSPIAFDQIARGADVEDYVTFYNPANGNTAVYDISIGFGTNGATNTIQSSQGFYMKTVGPSVTTTVDESDKINDNAGGIFGLVDPPPMLQMQISSAINSFSDEALVVFHTGAPALDSEDAVKYVFAHAAAPQLASVAPDGTELAINAYGTETNGISIPLKVNVGVTGTYTVELTEIGGLALTCVALHDLVTGTITPLNGYASYDFTVNANDDPTVARFMLRTTLPVADFTSNAPVAVGEDLAFNNSSVDAIDYNWDFGDGTTSTELDPTHAWASGGTYQVSLTATTGTCENTTTQAVTINSAALPLSVKVVLQGAYDTNSGLMTDALRSNNFLPTTEPYSAMGVTLTGGGGETTSQQVLGVAGNNAIVDWVYVELRDMNDPSMVVESRCGLLQRDGDIVDVNGTGPLAFGQAPGSYYVAVGHRNHLGVMTRTAIPLGTSTNALDLTQAPLFGDDAAVSISGTVPTVALWAGDVNTDGVIRYTGQNNDRDPILESIGGVVPTNTITGYHAEDVNMDGVARYTGQLNDRDIILENIGGVVPTNTRLEQMP